MLPASPYLTGGDTLARIESLGKCFYALLGQSNAVGQGDYTGVYTFPSLPIAGAEDPSKSYETAYSTVKVYSNINHGGVDTGWVDAQPYAASGVANMGPELSLARFLGTYAPTTARIAKYAVNGSSLAADWLSGSNYAAAAITFLKARQAELGGMRLGGVFWDQGEADASDATQAANYQTNLTTLVAMFRAVFGPIPWVFKRVNSTIARTYVADVRTAQAAYAAADSNSTMIDTEDVTLQTDGLHYDTRACQLVGDRYGAAMLKLQGYYTAPPAATAMPYYVGTNAQRIVTSGTVEAKWWGGTLAGDVGILTVIGTKDNNAPQALTTAAGFTLIGHSKSSNGTDQVWVSKYWCRADQTTIDANGGHMPTVTVANAHTNNAAYIDVFRNCVSTGTPYDVVASSQTTTYTTACSMPGGTTTQPNQLVVQWSHGTTATSGANKLAGFANASLANFTQQRVADEDTGTTSTAQGWVVNSMVTGELATAGAYTAATATYPIATLQNNISISLLGQNSGAAADLSSISVDATSGKLRPSTSAQVATLLTAAGIASSGGLFGLFNCQEASGNLADATGNGFTLTAANTPSYQNTDTGWTAKSVGMADNSTSNFANASASLADPSTTSYLLILCASITGTTAARAAARIGSTLNQTIEARTSSTPLHQLLTGATGTNGKLAPSGFTLWTLQHNVGSSRQSLFVEAERMDASTFVALAGKEIRIGRTLTASAPLTRINHVMAFSGASSEVTPSKLHKLYRLMGYTPQWM